MISHLGLKNLATDNRYYASESYPAVATAPTIVTTDGSAYNLRPLPSRIAQMADNVVAMTAEQLQQLLRGIREVPPPVAGGHPSGNFSTCQSRFSGRKEESVEAFINAITTFKDCINMTDANALKGLPMLLDSTAAPWWQGSKNTVLTWNDALTSLRRAYGINKPAHVIFSEVFSAEQRENEPTDIFVDNARALLALLPSEPALHVQH